MKIKDICHVECCPIKVPKGTPITVATVSPVNIKAIAEARFSGRTTFAAISVDTDIKIPCANDAKIRPTKSRRKVGAKADKRLPLIKSSIIANINERRFHVPVTIVRRGAPIVTPKAYKETVSPA